MTFFHMGDGPARAGMGAFHRRLRVVGIVLVASMALVLAVLVMIPLALLTLIGGVMWLIYTKLSRMVSSLVGGRRAGGRRNVRVIER